MLTRRTVVVGGATGRFGGLAEAMLSRGHSVRALTRDLRSADAERLKEIGAEVLYGDYDDPASVARAAAGADALFATGTAHRSGPDGELRHGLGLAEAAAQASVPHLVYVSGDGAAPDSPVPLFRAKFAVEERIRALGIPHTILAPVYLMENLLNPWNMPALKRGVLPSPIQVEAPLQQVAVADVIELATTVVERPGEFVGRRIAIAGDELSAVEAATGIEKTLGVHLEPRPPQVDQLPPGLRALFTWLEQTGHAVDVEGLKDMFPEVGWHRYADWLTQLEPSIA